MSSTSVVADFEAALQAMQNGKPPGVSGSKIAFLTDLSINNVQSESVIIQKLYTHFKRCPGTHKMGPLYAVDSIVRRYIEFAKKNNQEISASAPDGTFAAGAFRIQSLLPMLMNDILQHAPPEENKDKIEKLVSIWERSETFPPEVLADIKDKMHNSIMFKPKSSVEPTTPPGSPPQHVKDMYKPKDQADPRSSTSTQIPTQPPPATNPAPSGGVASILEMMAKMSKQNQPSATTATPTTSTIPAVTPAVSAAVPAPASALPSFIPTGVSGNGYPPSSAPGNTQSSHPASTPAIPTTAPFTSSTANPALAALMGGFAGYSQAQPQQQQQAQQPASTPVPQYQYPQQQQQQPQPAPATTPAVSSLTPDQLQLLQLVMTQPALAAHPSVAPVLQTIIANLGGATPNFGGILQAPTQAPPTNDGSSYWQQQQPLQQYQQHQELPRSRGGYSPPPLSPPRRGRTNRTRSRSPDRFGDEETRSPPKFRRRSPVYGDYDGNDAGGAMNANRGTRGGRGAARGGRGRGGRGGFEGGHDGPRGSVSSDQGGSSHGKDGPFPKVERRLEYDPSLGEGSIKVFSRTLFVGGVTISEDELHALFSQHGVVQSCIVNHDKRHAFVKMLTRPDAERAKSAMEFYKADHVTLRTRWGVGFGPRDCSDYQTGISIIPIERLTDADHRWMAKAEYGGTGGEPVRGGMVVEEPDIEIGSGVSSKAISKRFPSSAASDGSANHHPFGDKAGRGGRGRGGGRGGKFGASGMGQGQFGQQQPYQFNQQQFDQMSQQFGQVQQQQDVQADPRAPVPTGGVAPPTPGFGAGFPFAMPGWGQQR